MSSFIGTDGLRYAPANAQHRGRRSEQQDYFAFSDPMDRDFMDHGGLLAVLADGMGGMAHGAQASRIAVETFLSAYGEKDRSEEIASAMRRALDCADRAVFEFSRTNSGEEAGTTLIAAALAARKLFWIAVGDSAIYLYRDGNLALLNQPHTLGARLDRMAARGEIALQEALDNADRDALTSYVGIGGLIEFESEERGAALFPGDCLLLCSDGLFRALEDGEIAAVLDAAAPSQSLCDELIARTLERGLPHQDNVTVLCIRIE